MLLFDDRSEAGRHLASRLQHYADRPEVLVLALPRGGVAVAYEVGRALNVPMDVFIVRKLGVPGHEELAMGAIASGGIRVINSSVVNSLRIPDRVIDRVANIELQELRRREREYRGGRPPPDVGGKTVILVDDGLATGASMRAAALAVRQQHPKRIVVAVPTGAQDTCAQLGREVDEIVCATTPEPFVGIGQWYKDFSQMSDQQVRDLLARAWQEREAGVTC